MVDSKQTSSGSTDSGSSDLKTEVYSLMIPTINSHILLPNLSVAEIVPYSNVELFTESDGKALWFLGHLLWRGMHIPLISVDIIGGAKDPKANKRSRIAIVHTLNGNHFRFRYILDFYTKCIKTLLYIKRASIKLNA